MTAGRWQTSFKIQTDLLRDNELKNLEKNLCYDRMLSGHEQHFKLLFLFRELFAVRNYSRGTFYAGRKQKNKSYQGIT